MSMRLLRESSSVAGYQKNAKGRATDAISRCSQTSVLPGVRALLGSEVGGMFFFPVFHLVLLDFRSLGSFKFYLDYSIEFCFLLPSLQAQSLIWTLSSNPKSFLTHEARAAEYVNRYKHMAQGYNKSKSY